MLAEVTGRKLFEIQEAIPTEGAVALSAVESALLVGLINVQCLANPEPLLDILVLRDPEAAAVDVIGLPVGRGDKRQPSVWPYVYSLVGRLVVRSLTHGSQSGEAAIRAKGVTISLGTAAVDPASMSPHLLKLQKLLRRRTPVLLDAVRQARAERAERARVLERLPVGYSTRPDTSFSAVGGASRPPAVLVGAHWLELGGAEKMALEAVSVGREMGLVPIVVTDRRSRHPLSVSSAMQDAVFLPLEPPHSAQDDQRLLDSLLEMFDIQIVHIHHCSWLYARLPWLRARLSRSLFLDTLHIEERFTGGFPQISARVSGNLDRHHITSPVLRARLAGAYGVDPGKVEYAPMTDLEGIGHRPVFLQSSSRRPRVVGFVGRLTQQKRPFLFVELIRRLKIHADLRFIMHGSGELADETLALVDRAALGDRLVIRDSDTPASLTFDETDIYVNCAENEGLTIASVEAIEAGCLLVSTAVGSQSWLNAPELLVPQAPVSFVSSARRVISRLLVEEDLRARAYQEQVSKVQELRALQGARGWIQKAYREAVL